MRKMQRRILVNAAVGAIAEDAVVDGDAGDVVRAHAFEQRWCRGLSRHLSFSPMKMRISFALPSRFKAGSVFLAGSFANPSDGFTTGGVLNFDQARSGHLVELGQKLLALFPAIR